MKEETLSWKGVPYLYTTIIVLNIHNYIPDIQKVAALVIKINITVGVHWTKKIQRQLIFSLTQLRVSFFRFDTLTIFLIFTPT